MGNQEKYKALSEKLDELLRKHQLFSDEINAIRKELDSYHKEESDQPIPEKVTPEIIPVQEPIWPENIDLKLVIAKLGEHTEGATKAGTKFVKFVLNYEDDQYQAMMAESGKWIVQATDETVIASGRFNGDVSMFIVHKGINIGQVFTIYELNASLAKAAALALQPKRSNQQISQPASSSTDGSTVSNHTESVKASMETPVKVDHFRLEKFIGENLITVIGAVVILIGVIFGVKYSIDHNLINPLTRILLGYLLGLGLLGFAMKLKQRYHNFSAVLTSSSMAVMYFVTFAAYSYYALIPQLAAFTIMTLFTAFTAYAAINYNRQIIAHIGLVGAYAVPFLLSNNSGNVMALYSYMTIINAGILAVAFKKHWKPLYYVSFGVTWLIFLFWYSASYDSHSHKYFTEAMLFGNVFFLMFYAMFMVYKLIEKEKFDQIDIFMVVLNSMVYYGVLYGVLSSHDTGQDYLGVFTLGTALIHFVVSVILKRSELADKKLFYLTTGLVLVFLTIAIPVQLDGTWVTLLWGAEAALMFWLGRTKEVRFNEILSYGLMLIAIGSLLMDWAETYNRPVAHSFLNITFMTSMFIAGVFGFILFINQQEKYREKLSPEYTNFLKTISVFMSAIVIATTFLPFMMEIQNYWNKVYYGSRIKLVNEYDWVDIVRNKDLRRFGTLCLIAFSFAYAGLLFTLNRLKFRNQLLGFFNTGTLTLLILIFLTTGLFELSELRVSYLVKPYSEYFEYGAINVWLRYLFFAVLAGAVFLLRMEVKSYIESKELSMIFNLFIHTIVLWVLCAELINILDLSGVENQYMLGVSILCGLYSFMMVGLGIWKKMQYVRIAAISLFGVVLLKLFFYDIAHLSTISKTIIFITLGIILLVISFMYNKYKNLIGDENDN